MSGHAMNNEVKRRQNSLMNKIRRVARSSNIKLKLRSVDEGTIGLSLISPVITSEELRIVVRRGTSGLAPARVMQSRISQLLDAYGFDVIVEARTPEEVEFFGWYGFRSEEGLNNVGKMRREHRSKIEERWRSFNAVL